VLDMKMKQTNTCGINVAAMAADCVADNSTSAVIQQDSEQSNDDVSAAIIVLTNTLAVKPVEVSIRFNTRNYLSQL
jgi:hypothetical protein